MPTIPAAILHDLKCVRCKNWLSCGPVRLLPNGGSICGRCRTYEGPKDQYRHFAFEALACYFTFPCKYWENNCPEGITFKHVLDHEKHCPYGSTCRLLCSHPSAAFKSKRYLDIREAINLVVIPDEVLEYLRCSNCAGYLSCTPIYVCRDGTSICHRCNCQLPESNGEFIRDLCFEAFVDMMIFPCIYRYRGCTQMFKFGEQMMEHEIDCSYGKPYTRETRHSKPDSQDGSQKERGVIKTHSGHIYATITPNAPLFSPHSASNKNQEIFVDEFQRHRENLSSKWGRYHEDDDYATESITVEIDASQPQPAVPTNNIYVNPLKNSHLIDELKVRQHYRNSVLEINQDPKINNAYYYKENEPNKSEYSVYNPRS